MDTDRENQLIININNIYKLIFVRLSKSYMCFLCKLAYMKGTSNIRYTTRQRNNYKTF